VVLSLLAPVVWLSDHVGLTRLTDAAATAAGRDPHGAVGGRVGDVDVGIDELPGPDPSASPPPIEPPEDDTELRVPTTDKPLRVVVVGDSLAAGMGYFAERVFKPSFVNVYKRGRISTGLARPDFFNWPAEMRTIAEHARPDLILVMLGENDRQALRRWDGTIVQDIGTYEWPSAYEERVEQFARLATRRGAHLIWVGLPNERDQNRWELTRRQNDIWERVAALLPNVAFFDTWEAFDGPNGGYTAYYRDGSKLKLVRADDGIHFNSDGYALLMEQVARFATREFDLDPKTYES
jgi:hypothetical protein